MANQPTEHTGGYGKPPVERQFKKGLSGNPNGRPKGSKNLNSLILKESRRRIRIKGGSTSRTVTALQATIMQIGNKAAQGQAAASTQFLRLVQMAEQQAEESNPSAPPLTEADRKLMLNILKRVPPAETDSGEDE